ncbi:single-stranded-DNA-specific exonuclease RecJ [Ohessyouella blattaphilus]|uniref:Single-stranded-DNA-specific exonuclease RecJ n=1 Tax=Ohessyouella blattaphilus TaxID=2949333 RepID=A0ABT1EL02_9FIRM|nr:single-stranded-DNA-specific exonuclease RecJ [Ohessyouella blattaphilus]MCP1111378.1 single-stranded-DNA-specific exonuclease RecJ [Ohessyouella blattaphilus]MCR8564772.1 single-stranded-DNA-specific exonuclease RecJ [Ohessyouella blattaphilus]
MKKWFLKKRKAEYSKIVNELGVSPLLATIMANRGVRTLAEARMYMAASPELLGNPLDMKGVSEALRLIEEYKEAKIRIVGDYDIDGVTATYILLKGLEKVGIQADYQIPDRIEDGYGINESIVEKAYQDGIHLLITCDNGIAALSAITRAKELGMAVIITDHHNIPLVEGESMLPPADVIINPKQDGCKYPYKNICGAVVAWKLVCALHEKHQVLSLDDYLEFAAIGTIGDVMELQEENRLIAKLGIRKLAVTENEGLIALAKACGISLKEVTAYHIGFVLGPCINASGRLSTARHALRLLLADKEEASALALSLKELNDERKSITEVYQKAAFAQVEEHYLKDKVLVLFLPDCHESIAGIIAGKVREKYYKPCFVLTKGKEGIKGSGRSIEGYDMYQALAEQEQYLEKYGGHTLAAGLSLADEEQVVLFREAINRSCTLTEEDLIEKVYIDAELPVSQVTKPLIESLKLLEPFGNGNRKPIFACKNMRFEKTKVLGKNQNVLKGILKSSDGEMGIDGILFAAEAEKIKEEIEGKNLSVLYYPELNEFRNVESLQAVITDFA